MISDNCKYCTANRLRGMRSSMFPSVPPACSGPGNYSGKRIVDGTPRSLIGTVVYCSRGDIVLRAALCHFCLGDRMLPSATRWFQWNVIETLNARIAENHADFGRPHFRYRPRPSCSVTGPQEDDLELHLQKHHGLFLLRIEFAKASGASSLKDRACRFPLAAKEDFIRGDVTGCLKPPSMAVRWKTLEQCSIMLEANADPVRNTGCSDAISRPGTSRKPRHASDMMRIHLQ